MNLGQRIKECRKQLQWSQQQVAGSLKVPRELLSMWENGVRQPTRQQVEALAVIFNVCERYLQCGDSQSLAMTPQSVLYRGGSGAAVPESYEQMQRWLDFLDRWALITRPNVNFARAKPPKALDRGSDFRDIRSAAKVAGDVRDFYNLGLFALPDLPAFLDELQVLVCHESLGTIGDGNRGISGAFYNHPRLGYCILVNGQTSLGRQMFTLAHEFAHALFHYGDSECIVSRDGENSAREHFADAFAAHFLVPTKGLLALLNDMPALDEYDVLSLAYFYQVSYAFMLNRLLSEGIIRLSEKKRWQCLSPRSLAKHVGLDPTSFAPRTNLQHRSNYYPPSVLHALRHLINSDSMSQLEAASLLGIDPIILGAELLQLPAAADPDELRENSEFTSMYSNKRAQQLSVFNA